MKIPQNRQFNAGIYTRLSVDDNTNTARNYQPIETSQSIHNQVAILTNYVQKSGWNLIKVYSDDGFTGSNFNRPAFQNMIEDAKKGYIDLIIVKDLSRVGRDAVGVGMYTEELFPSLGIRFVSVAEGIDTYLDSDEFMPFYAMMHDYHLKNLSKSIKRTLRGRAEQGKCVHGGVPPYGYIRSPEDKNLLVINEEAAEVVKLIFELRLQRIGYAKIAGILNEKNIFTPTLHWNKITGKEYKKAYLSLWRDITVKAIVRNEVYTGRLIQMKTGTQSYKSKKTVAKDESEWVVTENAHEAIISREVWEEAQSIDLRKYTTRTTPEDSLFQRLLRCADCGKSLVVNTETHRRKNGAVKKYKSYHCAVYYQTGRKTCSAHRIYEIGLKAIVKEDLLKQAGKIKTDVKALKAELQQRICSDILESGQLDKEIAMTEKQLADCAKKEILYYEDNVNGKISDTMFGRLISELAKQQAELNERLSKLMIQKESHDKKLQNIDKWIRLVKKYANLQEIDRTYLEELIDYIEIGERQVTDGMKHQDIKIVYKFVGCA